MSYTSCHVTVDDFAMCSSTSQELSYRTEVINVDRINKQVGVVMAADEMAARLTRMCLDSEVVDKGKSLRVQIPPTRADILLVWEIMLVNYYPELDSLLATRGYPCHWVI